MAITSNALLASPATIPAATAASIPFKPFVLGTTTLLTFLIIFPLTSTKHRLGLTCNISRALLAQYDNAIGSVHPVAGTNSSFKI